MEVEINLMADLPAPLDEVYAIKEYLNITRAC
jgi:hypothetical protein